MNTDPATPKEAIAHAVCEFFQESEFRGDKEYSFDKRKFEPAEQCSQIAHMVTCKSLEDAFQLADLGSHAQKHWDKVWRDLIHTYKELGHKEEDLRAFFVEAVKTQITQIASERYKAGKSEGISISFIRGGLEREKPRRDWSRFWAWVAGAIAAVVIVGGIIFGISINKVANPTVAIEINLGEVLAGLLGGAGVAIAGIAYARKTGDPQNDHPINKHSDANR